MPPPKVKKKPPRKKPKINKKAQKSAFQKLKMMDALDKIKKQVKQEKAAPKKPVGPKTPPPPKYVGNVITSGSSLQGLDKLSMNEYYGKLEEHIRSYWFLPQWLDELDLNAQALVQIDERGYVINRKIYSGSGNTVFDKSVLETIDKASPLPAPPDRLKSVLKNNGFVLKFPH